MAEAVSPTTAVRVKTSISELSAGLIVGFTQVILAVSLPSLIFSGLLAAELPRGIAIGLVTAAVAILFSTFFSSSPRVTSAPQDNPAVLLAVAAAAITGVISTSADLAATVIALIFVTTMLTGVFLVILGTFDLGRLVRYIPYPVIGGFLAGTGWLLAVGGVGTMVDFPLSLATLPDMFASDQLILWVPGVLFGFVLFFGVRYIGHFLALPGLLLGGLIVFYVLLVISSTSVTTATEIGLLLGDIGDQAMWNPLPLNDLRMADWSAILGQAGSIGTVVVLTAIALLLNVSGLELILREDIDLNRELRSAGFGNMLSGLAGGMIGYQALSLTMLRHRAGGRGRAAGVIAALMCLTLLFVGASVLAYTPRPILAGLLLFLGLDFLYEWVFAARKKLTRLDHGVVLLILVIIAVWGFLVGVSVGLVLMVVLFAVNYSRTNIFHHELSGAEVASHVERSAHHRRALSRLGRHIYVLELSGFLFFGTANVILERIRERLHDSEQETLQFLILDFRRVNGMDSSAVFSLTKVKYLAEVFNFALIFSHLTEDKEEELARNGLAADDHLRFFPDLDRGMEWCENELLARDQITKTHIAATLRAQLEDCGFNRENTERLKAYMEAVELEPGEHLMHQGEESTDLYFIEIGQVSVYLHLKDDRQMRIQTLNMGTIVGELGFYLNVPRSASVTADLHTRAYRLTAEAMERMKHDDPDLVIAFNELMLQLVCERLIANNRELAALNR
jgi:sulfate permease, SulP family